MTGRGCRCRHDTANPERGCECGYAEWRAEQEEAAEAEREALWAARMADAEVAP